MQLPSPGQQFPARNSSKDAEFEWLLCLASALQSEPRTESLESKRERPRLAAVPRRSLRPAKSNAA